MAIKMVPDLGAPVAVTAVKLITRSYAPDYQEWAEYVMAAGGYLGAWLGWGGDFVKNVGISALPGAAERLYDRVKGGASSVARTRTQFRRAPVSSLSRNPMSRFPAPASETPFQGVKLT